MTDLEISKIDEIKQNYDSHIAKFLTLLRDSPECISKSYDEIFKTNSLSEENVRTEIEKILHDFVLVPKTVFDQLNDIVTKDDDVINVMNESDEVLKWCVNHDHINVNFADIALTNDKSLIDKYLQKPTYIDNTKNHIGRYLFKVMTHPAIPVNGEIITHLLINYREAINVLHSMLVFNMHSQNHNRCMEIATKTIDYMTNNHLDKPEIIIRLVQIIQ